MIYEQQILHSWHSNAAAWIDTILNDEIESRRLVTNSAIIAAIAGCHPQSMLDIGCGEGWLCRRASDLVPGLNKTVGLDAIPRLIEAATEAHPAGKYHIKSYEDIIEDRYRPSTPFAVACFNFSLFGNEQVKELLTKIHTFIKPGGSLVIQTLHPYTACGDLPYTDGWREGSWKGFSQQFSDPAPWYFRTMESWVKLFGECGYNIKVIGEPIHPVTGKPASVIFTCQPVAV